MFLSTVDSLVKDISTKVNKLRRLQDSLSANAGKAKEAARLLSLDSEAYLTESLRAGKIANRLEAIIN